MAETALAAGPHWTTILTVTIAAAALALGFLQWKLAQNRLKLDLFERRLAIYNGALKFLEYVRDEEKSAGAVLQDYWVATHQAKWLLDDAADEYLTGLLDKARLFMVHRSTEKEKRSQEGALWYLRESHALAAAFGPYLSVRHSLLDWKRLRHAGKRLHRRIERRAKEFRRKG